MNTAQLCELCLESGTLSRAKFKVFAVRPCNDCQNRYVSLCEVCAEQGWSEDTRDAFNDGTIERIEK